MATLAFDSPAFRAAPCTRTVLTQRGKRVVSALVLAVVVSSAYLLSAAFSAVVAASDAEVGAVATATVVVERGQTLWQIAREVAPSVDPRVTVDRIATLNALPASGALQAGSTLVVPLD